ncbi:MAG: Hsp20/alpha crystallin family protein [Planctomycetaceae bacterium]
MTKTINPFDIINHLDREFDGLFGKIVDSARTAKEATTHWVPAMNVTESSEGFVVTLDVPGLKSDAFDIEFKEGVLTVSGERPTVESDDIKWHRSERRFGGFKRTVSLDEDIDIEKLDAEYRDGVLHISLPKREAVRPTKISVR